MNQKHHRKLSVLSCLAFALIPTLAQAATPRVMLEKSASYALDSRVRAFRVPTVDSSGVVKYYDVTITLGVNTDGTLLPTANVASTLSRNVISGAIVPGTYTSDDDPDHYTCNVSNTTLTNGRIQSFLSCTSYYGVFQVSVATGRVSAGHPYQSELVAAGVDKRSDVDTQTWGVVTSGSFMTGGCYLGGALGPPTPVGAKTNGKNLILSLYTETTPSAFRCSGAYTKK